MPDIQDAIDFLEEYEGFDLGESPWPTYDDNDEIHEVDWGNLFPSGPASVDPDTRLILDAWEIDISENDLEQLAGILEDSDVPDWSHDGKPAGHDVVAWYQPIHYFGHDWGIFIKESGIKGNAFRIARFLRAPKARGKNILGPLWKGLIRASFAALLLHEHFHHKIESLGFRLHVSTGYSAYLP
ncbi:hypothetical protein ES703_20747 [subsurface metagenome]